MQEIFVPLLNEGTPVWRPALGEHFNGFVYRLLGPIPPNEEWQFQPGELVSCESRSFQDGKVGLAAVRVAGA